MSMPHFLGCDPDVQKYVQGIHPIREDYESHLDVEPVRIAESMVDTTLLFRDG